MNPSHVSIDTSINRIFDEDYNRDVARKHMNIRPVWEWTSQTPKYKVSHLSPIPSCHLSTNMAGRLGAPSSRAKKLLQTSTLHHTITRPLSTLK